jgi:endonuclease/exonuclease/phosphatase family metal-dependent hydrolase
MRAFWVRPFVAVVVASVIVAGEVPSIAQEPRPTAVQPAGSAKPGNRFGLSLPRPRTPGSIRMATYNMLNLFDEADDPALSGEFDDIKFPTARDRCAKLAEAIKAVDADIIGLEEVESLDALKWFRDTFLPDAGYAHLASMDAGYYRGVECSVMSRFPITDVKVWLNESLENVKRDGIGWATVPADAKRLTFQRSPLMVTVEPRDGYELTVFVVHHKAGGDFDYHREAEALRLVEIINDLQRENPRRNIAVMGDFNCAPWDKSMRVYLAAGLIDTLAHRTTGRNDPESPLFKTHESDRVLDYILLNSAAHRELVIDSAFVLGTLAPPPSYDYRKDPHPRGYASDHYPVAIELRPVENP